MLTIAQLNALDRAEFTTAIGNVFEHSAWIAEATWPRHPFRDVGHLHQELCATMRAASHEQRLALIRAHPDLAGRLAQQRQLTAASNQEQASAGLHQLTPDELALFQQLNDLYRSRYRFPFIICARLNQKSAILEAMRNRLGNPPEQEFDTALGEIEKIARLRLDGLVVD